MMPPIPAPPFAAMMQRFRGEIERNLYAAELACNQQNGCNFNKDTSCPFSDSENPSCRLEQIREAVGEHRPPGLCEFAAWLDGYFLCKSQNECEFQDGAGPTFYCGREAAVLAFLEQEQQAGDQHE